MLPTICCQVLEAQRGVSDSEDIQLQQAEVLRDRTAAARGPARTAAQVASDLASAAKAALKEAKAARDEADERVAAAEASAASDSSGDGAADEETAKALAATSAEAAKALECAELAERAYAGFKQDSKEGNDAQNWAEAAAERAKACLEAVLKERAKRADQITKLAERERLWAQQGVQVR
eukprot:scaffold337790_cov27-Prasinocladus_malaysianus.AAC.1